MPKGAVLEPVTDATPAPVARRRRRVWGTVWVAVVVVLTAGVLLVTVLPVRVWLDQRAAIADAERRLARLEAENERLRDRVADLGTPEEVERLARQEYQMARPGERVYALLPPPDPAAPGDGWPLGLVRHLLELRAAASAPPVSVP